MFRRALENHIFCCMAYILRFLDFGVWWPGAQNLCFDAPSRTIYFLVWLLQRLFDFGHLVAMDPESMFRCDLENYLFSVIAYTALLRFRAFGGQGPRIHVLTRPRELHILCYGLYSDCSISGIWWPGTQNQCFDAPSKTTYFRLLRVQRFFDSGPLVARGPESIF